MKKTYQEAVLSELVRTKEIESEIVTEHDMAHLPEIVKKYLQYVGVPGKEKVLNFRAEFKGGIRNRSGEPFMKLKSVQYNFTDNPSRLFYITARKMGIPAKGIHIYKDETAIMKIKLLGLFTIADAKGDEMNEGETVTVFNDMCLLAPASLIDENISWEIVDRLTVNATFTNGNITIAAKLSFDSDGRLVNFMSNDRYETIDGKTFHNYPWSTPISAYAYMNGYHLPSKARLIYQKPNEDFCYGEFELVNIAYNCKELR